MGPLSQLLKANNVKKIYFCSGSRNASLENELSANFDLIHHYEERQASFMALGESNMSNEAVAICTTSGTAALECLPAMAEAYFSQSKLILITADRPDRLRDTGAPQCLNQLTSFGPFVKNQIDEYLNDIQITSFPNFPVQVNLKIDDAVSFYSDKLQNEIHTDFSELDQFIKNKNPLIIVSHGYPQESTCQLVHALIESNYVVLLEKSCNVFVAPNIKNVLYLDKDFEKCISMGLVDSVVRIGHTPLTRLWRDFDRKYTNVPLLHIDPRGLPAIGRGTILKLTEKKLLETFDIFRKNSPNNHIVPTTITKGLLDQYPLSELAFFNKLSELIPSYSNVYIGNSMPIRYWQMLPSNKHNLYYNRGVNGIDGQIATSIGVARATEEKVFAIVGDLTALYDIACLMTPLPKNWCLIVINNYGGRIFEQVGHSGNIINEHNESICDLLKNIQTTARYEDPGKIELKSQIIELFPSLEESRGFWDTWKSRSS